METQCYGLIGDVPVGEYSNTDKDGLDRKAFATVLAGAVVQTHDTLTIGVYGGWGEGKTSLMRLIKREMEEKFFKNVIAVCSMCGNMNEKNTSLYH